MSFSRVLCYPVKALGYVSINGSPITRGETIQQFGELRIDLGTYRQDDIVLYNNAQQWTPVSIEGNVLVYNVQSNGKFYIYDNARKVVFDFTNDMQQDFTIDSVYRFNESDYSLRDKLSSGRYAQINYRTQYGPDLIAVHSRSTDISALELSAEQGVTFVKMTPPSSYDNTWVFFRANKQDKEVGDTYSVSLGNVLVAFWTIIS